MTFLIGDDVNLLRELFLVGRMSNFLALGWDSRLITRVSQKGSGEGETVHTWWG